MATADFSHTPAATGLSSSDSNADAGTVLQSNLERLAQWRNRRQMLLSLAGALTWALGINTIGLLAYRFYLLDGRPWMLLVPIVFALIVGFIIGRRRSRGAFEAAQEADQSLEWQDRLSSALAFVRPEAVHRVRKADINLPAASTPLARFRAAVQNSLRPRFVLEGVSSGASTELVPALVEEAAARSNTLNHRQLYPLQFNGVWRRLALTAAMFLVTCFMRDVPWLLSSEQKATASTLKEEGKKLEAISKDIQEEKKEVEKAAEVKKLNQKLAQLGKEMQRGRMTKRAALAEMGELKKKLEEATKNSEQNSGKNFQQAMKSLGDKPMQTSEGKQFKKEMGKGDLNAAAKQAEKLADRLEKGGLNKEEQKQAASDLEKAAEALKQAGGEKNQQMAKQVEDAAKALREQSQQNSSQGQKNGQQNNPQNGPQNNQQSGQNSQGQDGSQQQNQAGAAAGKALREMAKGLQQGGSQSGDGQSLQNMLKQIEEAEAQTGSNSGGQSGQGQGKAGEGKQGQGQGEGQGQGLTPGKDIMPSNPSGPVNGGAGLGPRNNAGGSAGGGPSDQKLKRNGDKRRWEDVWSDRLPATKKDVDRIKGKYGSEGEAESLQTQSEAKGGSVNTPYYEVYESYKKDAEDAISKEVVPPSYKQPVKEYFDSLKPEG